MAVESPEKPQSRGMSPRISFSHDLGQFDVVPVEPHQPLSPASLSASASFNFQSQSQSLERSCSADELFSNGVLLPLQTPKLPSSSSSPAPPPPPPTAGEEQSRTRKPPPPPTSSPSNTSSFWKFRRSRSCNCGGLYTGTLCPILLPRSKSTGSNSSSKRSLVSKEDSQHHNRNPAAGVNGGKQRSPFSGYQKPPLNKGSRVSPVLNVSSGNMFGFGSFFSSIGKDKSGKKKLVI